MTDRMTQYRFRGNVKPSAEVSRPVAAQKNAAADEKAPTSATLDIFDVIDSYGGWWGISARDVDAALKTVGAVDTLYVRINSPGGEATEGVAIANLLRAHPGTVRVTVYGLAASAASMIAVAGDVVSMAPGSMLMVHDAWDFAAGPADDLRKAATVLDAVSDSYAGMYATKAGGTADEWRAVMRESVWYGAEAAVKAKLADQVGLDPTLPNNLPPVEEDDTDDATVVEIQIEVSPAARAAARRFDLSMLPNAPAALAAPQTPAEPPETPPTEPKEADAMSDTLLQGLRERFDLPEDADESAILAKADEVLDQATKPDPKAPEVPSALPEGTVAINADALEELRIAARAGQEARAVQLRQDRDETINAAITAGHISRARREHWTAKWDADPEGIRAALAELTKGEPIFPVGEAPGHGKDIDPQAKYTDDMAAEDAELFGLPKEAFAR